MEYKGSWIVIGIAKGAMIVSSLPLVALGRQQGRMVTADWVLGCHWQMQLVVGDDLLPVCA